MLSLGDVAKKGNTLFETSCLEFAVFQFSSLVNEIAVCKKVPQPSSSVENLKILIPRRNHYRLMCIRIPQPTLRRQFVTVFV